MRILHALVVPFALVPLAASGCWFFSPTGLDGTVEAVARAECHFAFACCTPTERGQFLANGFRDEGACVSETLEEANGGNNLVDRAKAVIAAGKGAFVQARADECLKPFLDARNSCDADAVLTDSEVDDPLCVFDQSRGFVVGNVKDGDDCNDDLECASFGVCDRSANDEDVFTTEGKCKEAKGDGDVCFDPESGDAFACVPGTSCQIDGGESVCKEIELQEDGEACFANSDCESRFCGEDEVLTCNASGGPCAVDEDCPGANFGETCDPTLSRVCGENKIKVEVCDGLGS